MQAIRYIALIVAVAGFLGFKAGGAAADTPYVIGPTDLQGQTDWTGFYIGGKVGGAWSDTSWSQNGNLFTLGSALPAGTLASFEPNGVAGGVIGGGNLQVGRWIFGAELSYQGTDLSQTIPSPFFPATDTFTTQIDWLGTIEGRIGVSFHQFLVFGKFGWAGSNAKITLVRSTNGVTATADDFVDGWTAGGGIEYVTLSRFVFGLEYDYVDISLSNAPICPLCAGLAGGAPTGITGDATISSVMARASYLFFQED